MSSRHQVPNGSASGAERRYRLDCTRRLLHPEETGNRQEQKCDRRKFEDGFVIATNSQNEEAETETEQRPEVAQSTSDTADSSPVYRCAHHGEERIVDNHTRLKEEVRAEKEGKRGPQAAADEKRQEAAAGGRDDQQWHAPRQMI